MDFSSEKIWLKGSSGINKMWNIILLFYMKTLQHGVYKHLFIA